MHRIEIMKGNKEYSFDIERYKLIIGKNDFERIELCCYKEDHRNDKTRSYKTKKTGCKMKISFTIKDCHISKVVAEPKHNHEKENEYLIPKLTEEKRNKIIHNSALLHKTLMSR